MAEVRGTGPLDLEMYKRAWREHFLVSTDPANDDLSADQFMQTMVDALNRQLMARAEPGDDLVREYVRALGDARDAGQNVSVRLAGGDQYVGRVLRVGKAVVVIVSHGGIGTFEHAIALASVAAITVEMENAQADT